MNCSWCEEPVLPGESNPNLIYMQDVHRECAIRMVCGSVAHLEGRCGCHNPESEEADPPGMTRRQAAQAAERIFRVQQRLKELGVVPNY